MEAARLCNACLREFPSMDAIREHYRTAFHQYNLKRRTAGLAPVNEEVFEQIRASVLARGPGGGASASPTPSGASPSAPSASVRRRGGMEGTQPGGAPRRQWVCKLTRKTFASRQQYEQHLRSRKYQKALANAKEREAKEVENDGGVGRRAGEEEEKERPSPPDLSEVTIFSHCTFCLESVDGLAKHLEHAERAHGFVVPDAKYLQDLEGLMNHVMAKVLGDHDCPYCSLHFPSAHACQQHMRDSGHCKLPFDIAGGDGMAEYDEHFNYSRRVKFGAEAARRRLARLLGEDEVDGARGEAPTSAAAGGGGRQEEEEEEDEEVAEPIVLPTGEILLPNGMVMGHRELRRLYKQRLPVPDTRQSVLMAQKEERARRLKSGRLLTAGPGAQALVASGGRPGFFHVRTKEAKKVIRAKRDAQKQFEAQQLATGVQNNKLQRLRFRGQVGM